MFTVLGLAPLLGLVPHLSPYVPLLFVFFFFGTPPRGRRRRRRDRLSAPHDVTIDDACVTIGARRIARSTLRDAYVVPRAGRAALHLTTSGRRGVELVFERATDADDVMRILSLDPARHMLHVLGVSITGPSAPRRTMVSEVYVLPWAAALFAYFVAALLGNTFGGLPFTFFWVFFFAKKKWRALRIGVDGIVWSFGGPHFVPISTVKSARRTRIDGEHVVQVALTNGETLSFDAGTRERAGIVSTRIRELVRLRDEGPSPRDVAALLERGDRSASQWFERLRTLSREGGRGYRNAPLGRDELVRVASSPAGEEQVRIAAAAALASAGEREEVASLARATADPFVRISLEFLARDDVDDQGIVEALVELERHTSARS